MGKYLLFCFIILNLTITASFGQTEQKPLFQQEEQPFVENEIREGSNSIEFYPNPSQDDLNVKINDKRLQHVEFEIYNIIGNSIKIEVEEIAKGHYKIPVRTFSPGYYLLVVQDKESRFKQAYKFQKK